MNPLAINKEFVLMFTLRQVQDCYKIIVASKEEKTSLHVQNVLNNNVHRSVYYKRLCCRKTRNLLFMGILLLQLLKEPVM